MSPAHLVLLTYTTLHWRATSSFVTHRNPPLEAARSRFSYKLPRTFPSTAIGIEEPRVSTDKAPGNDVWESPLESTMISDALTFDEKMVVIDSWHKARPLLIASRLATVGGAAARVAAAWEWGVGVGGAGVETRGDFLRKEVSALGVVFVKLAQTLATREDLVGAEAATSLGVLQDSNVPFPDELAMLQIRQDLNWPHPLPLAPPLAPSPPSLESEPKALFAALSPSPLAAASMAQVYKGVTWCGAEVAVKVRRPQVVPQIALDVHCIRLLLENLRKYWGSTTDIAAVSSEVCSGLFLEVDLRQEARNAQAFAAAHAGILPLVTVPRNAPTLSARRVLTTEWVDGGKLPNLNPKEQRAMVKAGLDACFAQLLGTGIVHADPHYGNMLWTLDGRLCLLDFGLVTSTSEDQRDAMARAILCLLNEDWESLLDAYRLLGVLPLEPCVWVNPKTGLRTSGYGPGSWALCDEGEFRKEFVSAMTKRGEGRRAARSFSEIVVDLSVLALEYKFILPPWMVFVVRAVITLDGFALKGSTSSATSSETASETDKTASETASEAALPSTSGDGGDGGESKTQLEPSVNAIEAAYPHALKRVLSPTTPTGTQALSAALVDPSTGDLQWDRLTGMLGHQDEDQGQDQDSSADASGAASALCDLLASPSDGQALRRLVHSELKAGPLLGRAQEAVKGALDLKTPLPAAARASARAANKAVASAFRSAFRSALKSSKGLKSAPASAARDAAWPPSDSTSPVFEAYPQPWFKTIEGSGDHTGEAGAFEGPREDPRARAGRRVRFVLVRAHLKRILQDKKLRRQATALVLSVFAVMVRVGVSDTLASLTRLSANTLGRVFSVAKRKQTGVAEPTTVRVAASSVLKPA